VDSLSRLPDLSLVATLLTIERMTELIDHFRTLHERKKNASLSGREREEYDNRLRELTHLALVARQLRTAGERRFLRTAVVLDVELDDGQHVERSTTIDVAPRGFAVMLSRGIDVGTSVRFRLHLLGGRAPINGVALVASRRAQTTSAETAGERFGFTFEQIEGGGRELLEDTLVDVLLARFDQSLEHVDGG
jgi:hypothetical protein